MCVEVHELDHVYVEVRNSRTPHTVTSFDREEWQAFVDGVKAGDFDLKVDVSADAEEMLDQV